MMGLFNLFLILQGSSAALKIGTGLTRRRAITTCAVTPTILWRDAARASSSDEAAYAASPADLTGLSLPPGCAGVSDVFLVFHGAGGPDRETTDLISRVKSQDAAVGFKRTVKLVDWRPWFTQDGKRISYTGQDIGRKLGEALAVEAPMLKSLHVVGTSAGAWPADACCSAYVEAAGGVRGNQRAAVVLSLTDPFTARAEEFSDTSNGWGARNYGKSADYAEHYLNADDIVPSTSDPLPNCYCFDVTGAAERKAFPLPGGGPTGNRLQDLGLLLLTYHSAPLHSKIKPSRKPSTNASCNLCIG